MKLTKEMTISVMLHELEPTNQLEQDPSNTAATESNNTDVDELESDPSNMDILP